MNKQPKPLDIDVSSLLEEKKGSTDFKRFWCARCGRESLNLSEIVHCDHSKKYEKNLKDIRKAIPLKNEKPIFKLTK
jgi:hypothetical protein